MKNRNFKIGALLVSLFAASCSPALYQSGAYNIDDMYAEHDVTRIAQEKQAIAEARKAEAEARRAEIEARQAEAAYYASDDSYQGVLADTYESAYARRLRGFSSPTYQMPTSYFNLRYNGTYQFVSAYDPAVYNIIVMGDEVWVEPKYITSMFGTWGSPSIVSFGWSAGLYNDWYFSWGYNPYPWAYPGFGWPYYSYNPYWGYPYWGGYYPYWGYYPGWGGGHHHHPYPPHHRPNVVHRSTYRYGSGAGSNIGSTSFGGRGQGGMTNGYRNGTTIGSGEVTLKREDGSTIEVGSAIEGMQSDMRELDGRVNRMGVEIKEVGALSAALAGLHPQPENANRRADLAMAMGSYEGKQALAVGGFYRPDKRTMLSIGASTTSSKHMMNMGISIALDRLPEAERRAKEAAKAAGVEQETLNRVLERLAALEQDNRRLQADNEKRDVAYEKLAADYTQLKEKYIEETADRQQPEQAEAEE